MLRHSRVVPVRGHRPSCVDLYPQSGVPRGCARSSARTSESEGGKGRAAPDGTATQVRHEMADGDDLDGDDFDGDDFHGDDFDGEKRCPNWEREADESYRQRQPTLERQRQPAASSDSDSDSGSGSDSDSDSDSNSNSSNSNRNSNSGYSEGRATCSRWVG